MANGAEKAKICRKITLANAGGKQAVREVRCDELRFYDLGVGLMRSYYGLNTDFDGPESETQASRLKVWQVLLIAGLKKAPRSREGLIYLLTDNLNNGTSPA